MHMWKTFVWKAFKIVLIVILVIVLLFALLVGYAYIDKELTKNRWAKWTYCEVDEDCVLVKDYRICSCGSFSVNKAYESKYIPYRNKVVKNRETKGKFGMVMLCEMCAPPQKEVAKCIKNKCYAYSDNSYELQLLNMT